MYTRQGLIWGLQTLRQIYRGEGKLPCCSITDYPLYPWRSYLLDESRHFFGKESAMRVIDELSRLKMNTLHWHLTDGAGWRIEIPRYPLLTEVGSKMDYSHRGITPAEWDSIHPEKAYYTADEIKEIVQYARDRGVKIVPEIDMPGHSLAAITAYPWLGTSSRLAGKPVTGDVLQVSDPEVEQFMRNVIAYIIPLFDTDIIHIGGDEVDFKHWREADGVRAFMAEHGMKEPWQLQHWFVRRMTEFLKSQGCRTIGWNEITGHGNDPVSVPGTITQFWEGDTSKIGKAIAQGYKVVNSAQLFTYLDYDYNATPLWKTYRHHPSPTADNTNIVGFGAQMWTENVPDFARLCYMTFPRLAALAECGWSAPDNKNYADFIRRISPLQQYWRSTGILQDQPTYSTREPNAILPEKYRK
ncbi:MAG: beta-N-acetylhexosaminidase [Muribaculaceae bacterium]|nr:beta-N-acetylhexosaminidase [Muribaculaceae bacterium]